MKLKALNGIVGAFTLSGVVSSVHPQISPKPLQSFFVQSTMSSPQAGSPYPYIAIQGFAVRSDGSWVLITYGDRAGIQSHIRDIYDVANNIHTTIEDLSKSIQTRAMSESESRIKRVSAAASCGGKAVGQMLDFNVEYKEEKRVSGLWDSRSGHVRYQALACSGYWMLCIEERNHLDS